MKIPTIIALLLIFLLVSLGIGFLIYNQLLTQNKKVLITPTNILVANITDSSATITWQTQKPSLGQVIYGDNIVVSDKRGSSPYQTHFVTLKDLTPNTIVKYWLKDNDYLFPDKDSFQFKTSSQKSSNDTSVLNQKQPIQGSVVDTNNRPVSNALVFLQITDAAPLVTYTDTQGQFILPLKELRTSNLQALYNLNSPTSANLLVQKMNENSNVQITIPLLTNQPIPAITLGQNLDLREYLASPSAQTSPLVFTDAVYQADYDLNADNKVNALDLALIIDNINKPNAPKKLDINKDGKVNQMDIDVFKQSLE